MSKEESDVSAEKKHLKIKKPKVMQKSSVLALNILRSSVDDIKMTESEVIRLRKEVFYLRKLIDELKAKNYKLLSGSNMVLWCGVEIGQAEMLDATALYRIGKKYVLQIIEKFGLEPLPENTEPVAWLYTKLTRENVLGYALP